MNVDGTNQTKFSENTSSDFYPSWSPDGSKIVFTSDRDGTWQIFVMDPDWTNLTKISNNNSTDYSPFWSPDGSKIVFVSDRDGNFEIYVMDYVSN